MILNIQDDYQSLNSQEHSNSSLVTLGVVSFKLEDTYLAGQQLSAPSAGLPSYVLKLSLVDTYASTPTSFVGSISELDYSKISLSVVDDYQSLSVLTIVRKDVVFDSKFITQIIDDFGAQFVYSATPQHATPSFSFIVHIIDEFGDTPDEWVLITEDGFVISLEPFDDEFGITVV